MLRVVLFQPEIPANTGNIIRLCANTGAELHLIRPLGFVLDDRRLKRAGLDYHEYVNIKVHDDIASCIATFPETTKVFAATSKGSSFPDKICFGSDAAIVFGRETSGLPDDFSDSLPEDRKVRVPMVPGSRCYNLSNAAAIMLYEAWRQNGFGGCRRQ